MARYPWSQRYRAWKRRLTRSDDPAGHDDREQTLLVLLPTQIARLLYLSLDQLIRRQVADHVLSGVGASTGFSGGWGIWLFI